MRKIDKFIKEIRLISNRLNLLEGEYIESYEEFNGDEFDGQKKCVAEIENLILMLTHELSSQIGFGIEDLKTLLKYIDFRKTFKDYSDEKLLNIIDKSNDSNVIRKNENDIAKTTSEWNQHFENKGYEKVKEKLRLL